MSIDLTPEQTQALGVALASWMSCALMYLWVVAKDETKRINSRSIFTSILGGGFGSFTVMLAYDYIHGKDSPWVAISLSGLIGAGVIGSETVKAAVVRFFNSFTSGNGNDKDPS